MPGSVKWRIAQRLEIRWWNRYLAKKDVGTYLDWKRKYWRKFLEPISGLVDLGSPLRILDAGCGPAGIFLLLDQQFKATDRHHSVTAIDPLAERYRELPHFDPAGYPNTDFITTTIEAFRSEEGFDVIFCLNALNHVSDIKAATSNLFRHLKPGGRMVLSIDCHRSRFLKRLFRRVPGDALHPHQLDLSDYKALVSENGGRVIREHLSKPGRIFDYYVLVVTSDQ